MSPEYETTLSSCTVEHEIPGQSKVIPGSLDRLLKLAKSLDCPGQPWMVGNYGNSQLTIQDAGHELDQGEEDKVEKENTQL